MNIYVGNLSRDVTADDLREAFSAYGQVTSCNLIKDRYTGEPRGFAFVEMPVQAEAQAAISSLNGKNLKGQAVIVSEARPRAERGRGGGGGGGGAGGGRGRDRDRGRRGGGRF